MFGVWSSCIVATEVVRIYLSSILKGKPLLSSVFSFELDRWVNWLFLWLRKEILLGKLCQTRDVALPAGQFVLLREEKLLGLGMELFLLEGGGEWEEERETERASCGDASCLP